MRIGIDIKALKNGSTGISRYLRSIMDELQALDHENNYFLFECTTSDYRICNPKWEKILIPWKLPGILWQQCILPGYLKKYRIQVLWAPEQICPIFTHCSIKVITTVYDLTAIRFPETCQKSNLWIQRLLFPKTISRSSIITPISDYVKKEIDEIFSNRLTATLNDPVYCGKPDWLLPPDYVTADRQDFIFFPGNLEPRKNLPRLIRALELLYKKNDLAITLHLSGPAGWKNETLLSLLKNSPVNKNVIHLGFLSEERLKREYLSCKALVYPSMYEGFGLPVLEALSLDCMVLTSKNTVMEEIAGDAALYFNPQEIESIAEKISMVYSEKFNRNGFLRNAKNVTAKYSWHESAKKLLSFFSSPV
jgi:glycosyltransferase involved in cell wall biosynthesis